MTAGSGAQRRLAARALLLTGLAGLAGGGGGRVAAQEHVETLATACGRGNAALEAACLDAALAARAVQGGVGLAAALGAELPGSASTMGQRIDGHPRLGFALRGGFASFDVPDVQGGSASPAGATGVLAPGLQGTVAVGLFEGFSTAPTVGGILSLDLLATGSLLFLAEGDGFEGSNGALGLAARVGILRESFTLPGVTFSVSHRWIGTVAFGDDATAAGADVDVGATALRLTAGKDLMAVGVVAGAGWDRYAGDASIRATTAGPGPAAQGTASTDDFTHDRMVFFGGVSYTFLVLQVSAEGGWAGGFDVPSSRPEGGFDPGGGAAFGSLAIRLTY